MKLGIHSQDMQDFMTSHSVGKCEKWQGAASPLHLPLTQMSGMLLWLFCVTTLSVDPNVTKKERERKRNREKETLMHTTKVRMQT
jgi:hypothetical protein